MRRINIVVVMVAHCRIDPIHVLTKDSAVTGASIVNVFLGIVSSAVAMGGGQLLKAVLMNCFQWQF